MFFEEFREALFYFCGKVIENFEKWVLNSDEYDIKDKEYPDSNSGIRRIGISKFHCAINDNTPANTLLINFKSKSGMTLRQAMLDRDNGKGCDMLKCVLLVTIRRKKNNNDDSIYRRCRSELTKEEEKVFQHQKLHSDMEPSLAKKYQIYISNFNLGSDFTHKNKKRTLSGECSSIRVGGRTFEVAVNNGIALPGYFLHSGTKFPHLFRLYTLVSKRLELSEDERKGLIQSANTLGFEDEYNAKYPIPREFPRKWANAPS